MDRLGVEGVMASAIQLCEWSHRQSEALAPVADRLRAGEVLDADEQASLLDAHREALLRFSGFAAMTANALVAAFERDTPSR